MLDPDHTVVIANPAAGGGFVGRHWPGLGARIQGALGPVSLRLTETSGHAIELAREEARRGAETIISLGGDGTHSEVVNGIMDSGLDRRVALGVLHSGTGGDFRRMIDGADGVVRGCQILRTAPTTAIDVGRVEYAHDDGTRATRFFLNITSMGMSGLVDRHVGASRSRRSGAIKYLAATLRAQLEYKPARILLRVDGNDCGEHQISVVCVCNGRWAGGGMMFAPEARLTDGEFEVIVMRSASTLRGLPVLRALYKGTHVRSSTVTCLRGKRVEVEVLEHTAFMDIDGESPGTGPASFDILPKALDVIGVKPEFH